MHLIPLSSCCNHGIFSSQCSWKQQSRLSSYFLLPALVATFSCFRFTPGLAFGEKDIGHPAITEYLSLTGQGKLRNRKIILERKQTSYGNSLPVQRTDKESIFVGSNIFLSTNLTLFRNSGIYNKPDNKILDNDTNVLFLVRKTILMVNSLIIKWICWNKP